MSDIDEMIGRLTDRQQREYALKCVRRVQHLMRDPRSVAALDTKERWLRGEATDEEMAAAGDAAWAAAWAAACDAVRAAAMAVAGDAAGDAAWAAARAAACDAAGAAAWDAAGSAAWDAWDAAWAAAWAAERAWQREELERMLKKGNGA